FEKDVAQKTGDEKLPLVLKHPGTYRVEFHSQAHPEVLLGESQFTVDRKFVAIRINPPKVGGLQTSSSQLQGKVLKDFDMNFSWDPYAHLKNYTLYFYIHPKGE